MSPYVDVQRPECGEFTRYFKTMEDAERYVEHMRKDRGYLAEIRKGTDIPNPHNITKKDEERWRRTQELRRIANGGRKHDRNL